MFDECSMTTPIGPAVPPRGFGIKKAAVANAQIINSVPVEATQRDYAIELIKSIGEKHAQGLRVQFHLDNETPKTFLELVDAIKNGNYTLNEHEVNSDVAKYAGWNYGVHWGAKADYVGYKVANEALKAAAQKALTGVTLKTLDQLEAVIDGFEAWTL